MADPTTAERVRKVLTDFLVENCEADPEKVTDTANWSDEFGADSLDQVEMLITVEDELKLEPFDDEQLTDIRNIADAIKAVEAKLAVTA